MRIAICDDELFFREQLSEMLCKISRKNDEHDEIEAFGDAAELLAATRHKVFDAYLLDIVMPVAGGIEAAQALRELAPETPIVFITSSDEFAMSAFGVKAVRYLLKPVRLDALEETVSFLRHMLEAKPTEYRMKCRSGMVSLPTRDILYAENMTHLVSVTLADGRKLQSVSYRHSFAEMMEPLLCVSGFFQPHKSFVVNLAHIRTYATGMLEMENGEKIPISRSNAMAFKKYYLQFLARNKLYGGTAE